MTLYVTFDIQDTANALLNENIQHIVQRTTQWLVTFRPLKPSQDIKKNDTQPLYINNNVLEDVTSHKHLGLTVSKNRKWTNHINNIIADVSKISVVLRLYKP